MPLWRKTLSEDRMTSSIKHLGIVTELRRAPTAGKIRLRAIEEIEISFDWLATEVPPWGILFPPILIRHAQEQSGFFAMN